MQSREAFRWRPLRLLREAEEAVRKNCLPGAMLSCGSAPERADFCPRGAHLPGKGRTGEAFAAAAAKSTGRPARRGLVCKAGHMRRALCPPIASRKKAAMPVQAWLLQRAGPKGARRALGFCFFAAGHMLQQGLCPFSQKTKGK
ncbi:MAG: hypothetical protein DBY17_03430 [Oscillospiraceae bacterium]|nr:MAG: hypothetical protein DBY17_03430 [Oscillospiraceae bacterium]